MPGQMDSRKTLARPGTRAVPLGRRLQAALLGAHLQVLFVHHGCPLRIGAWPIDLSEWLADPLSVCLAIANWLR